MIRSYCIAAILMICMMPTITNAQARLNATTQAIDTFDSGTVWLDTDGNVINAHGGGVLFHDGIYFWFGEHKTRRRAGHIGVGCYSSRDLHHWKNEGLMLETQTGTDGDLVDGCVIERPHVIYNQKTGEFVMWFHFEVRGNGYRAARAAVAVSEKATGPYKYLGSFRPNAGVWPLDYPEERKKPWDANSDKHDPDYVLHRDFTGGQMSRDMTLFVDDNGSAYQIYASEENATLQISKLTDDYLKPAGQYVRILVGQANEAPAMFKRNGHYYLMTSGTTGWAPNAARLAMADAITGPWKKLGNPCVGPKEKTSVTFGSQAASILPVADLKDEFIYIGDRWNSRNLPDSRYIWLPVRFDGDRMWIGWLDKWDLSVFGKR
jgi:hypothetical protein